MKLLPLFTLFFLLICVYAHASIQARVMDISRLTWNEQVTVMSLQGLVNRQGPRLFVIRDGLNDRRWQRIYEERYDCQFTPVPDLRSLFEAFKDDLKGLVVYPEAPDGARWTALTLAGLENLVPVTEAIMTGKTPGFNAGAQFAGTRFEPEDLALWNKAAGAKLEATPEGARLTEGNPSDPWSFLSLPNAGWDLDKYPYLEVEVSACQGLWALKLSWDRDGDGAVAGEKDDLGLPGETNPGVIRYNLKELTGRSGQMSFGLIQLHILSEGGWVVWRSLSPCDAEGNRPPQIERPPLTGPGLPVVEDLRGKFETSAEYYRWALEELVPRCNKQYAYSGDYDHDGIPTGCGPFDGFDWVVMQRGPLWNLTASPEVKPTYGNRLVGGSPEEVELFERFLSALESPCQIVGYGEPEDVYCTTISKAGHYSFHFGANWSFYSQVPANKPEFHQTAPPPTPALEEKVYIAFMTSEGDTMKFPIPFGFGGWDDPQRGELPMNWGINPLMAEQFPAMLEWYYDEATPQDYFFAGCSGAGYTYPNVMPNVGEFAAHTGRLAEKADIHILDLWQGDRADVLAEYAEAARPLALTHMGSAPRVYITSNGTPVVFESFGYWQSGVAGANWRAVFDDPDQRKAALDEMAERMQAMAEGLPKPCFMLVYADLHYFHDVMKTSIELLDRLPSEEYEAVRLDTLVELVKEAYLGKLLLGESPFFAGWRVGVIEGREVELALPLQNTFDMTVSPELEAEGEGLQVELATQSPVLEPYATGNVRLRAQAEEGAEAPVLALSAMTEGDSFSFSLPVTVFPTPAESLPEELEEVAFYSAASLKHVTGSPGDEGSWIVQPGQDEAAHAIYGPYVGFPEGQYTLLVKLRALDEATGPIGKLDINQGGYAGSNTPAGELRY